MNMSNFLFQNVAYPLFNTRVGWYINKWMNPSGQAPHTIIDEQNIVVDARIRIQPVAIEVDNYAYIIADLAKHTVLLVDPADPERVREVLKATYSGFKVAGVLCTHKHHDHSGGNHAFKGVPIYGGRGEKVPYATHEVGAVGGEVFTLGRIRVTAYLTPCHTKASVMYLLSDPLTRPVLFSGDTLFQAGVGKFFEGSASDMLAVIDTINTQLPLTTLLYAGHEYTLANLEFANTVEPNNPHIEAELARARARRDHNLCTAPSSLVIERDTNVFLRARDPRIALALIGDEEEAMDMPHDQVLALLRRLRTAFRVGHDGKDGKKEEVPPPVPARAMVEEKPHGGAPVHAGVPEGGKSMTWEEAAVWAASK
ncbi:hydroxyacylglutathione hydrolase [Allomyces macrogynus ATCC 38327]|uniref:Hydroxyacylglutathione hydrolase n=1 Tax=Allomyces macrogynus (strain ATCC 38327) TaxID=578462 RepID=A0A0L0SB96_ALLM3|nr:hydroxyacylglutathione hydrolase [Allomyces macrogynus ATCC 38327]|eukprot:KNE59679.1 hydroxyacylglutathione hydrolase [Allomyces macrogynus ATCC 38327]